MKKSEREIKDQGLSQPQRLTQAGAGDCPDASYSGGVQLMGPALAGIRIQEVQFTPRTWLEDGAP